VRSEGIVGVVVVVVIIIIIIIIIITAIIIIITRITCVLSCQLRRTNNLHLPWRQGAGGQPETR